MLFGKPSGVWGKAASEVELPGGSTCSWESYPHDSQGESKAKLKQRFTDLTK